jgi:predicted neuraminidase
MLTRTPVGRIYRSDSEDGGESWCEAYATELPNNNSGIDLVKTPDGSLWLLSNPVEENWGERSPLTLQKSCDNGATWETVLVLEEEKKDSEFAYPAIEYFDGALYVSYTWERLNVAYWKIDL